jgi:hypothetical protein
VEVGEVVAIRKAEQFAFEFLTQVDVCQLLLLGLPQPHVMLDYLVLVKLRDVFNLNAMPQVLVQVGLPRLLARSHPLYNTFSRR